MDEETILEGLAAHVTYLRTTEKAYYQAQAAGTLTDQLTDQLADARKLVCHAAKELFPAEAMTLEARNAFELERLATVVRALRDA